MGGRGRRHQHLRTKTDAMGQGPFPFFSLSISSFPTNLLKRKRKKKLYSVALINSITFLLLNLFPTASVEIEFHSFFFSPTASSVRIKVPRIAI